MKNVLHLLLGFTCSVFSGFAAVAGPGRPALSSGGQDWQSHALQLSCYYTDALRLSSSQAAAVKQATRQELEQLNALEEAIVAPQTSARPVPYTVAQVLQQYDTAMLRILTPGQYSAFRLLHDKQSGEKLPASASDHIAQK